MNKTDKVVALVLDYHAKVQKLIASEESDEVINEQYNDEMLIDFDNLQQAMIEAGGPRINVDFSLVAWFSQTTAEEAKQIALDMLNT